jgi:hypothetical protein
MYKILFIVIIAIAANSVVAQPVDYSVPSAHRKSIKKNEYRKIVDITLPVVGRRFEIEYLKDGVIYLKASQELQVIDLTEVISKCREAKDPDKWEEVINGYFNGLFSAMDAKKNLDINQFETVKNYLSIRIYPKEMVERRGGTENLVIRTDLEGTYTLLMLDLQSAFTPVQQSVFGSWNKNIDEVFEQAQANVNKKEMIKEVRELNSGKTRVEAIFIENEDYAASYALDLMNNSPDYVGEWGAVVAMPNKGIVNICKVTKEKPLDFVPYIQLFKKPVAEFYSNHLQPVSDQFYWYFKGRFTLITVTEDFNGSINVLPPMALTALINGGK